MKEINIYNLLLDGKDMGVFTSKKSINKYIRNWEESYFNQDDCDINYIPKWEIISIEEE